MKVYLARTGMGDDGDEFLTVGIASTLEKAKEMLIGEDCGSVDEWELDGPESKEVYCSW